MISQMKHQFVELLASIGFVPNQLKAKDLDRAARGKGKIRKSLLPLETAIDKTDQGGADAVVAVTGPAINANNENNRVVSAVLCSALYPNIVKVNLVFRQENGFDHHTVITGFDS